MARKTHRSPEAAKTAILDAAESIMTEVGPAGLRISAVAKQAGMAHPNVIHHFGSREGLVEAVTLRLRNRATARITAAIKNAAEASIPNKQTALNEVLDTVFVGDEGRLAAWLHMGGIENGINENMAQILATAQALRETIDADADPTNTNRLVVLITLALLGEVVYGEDLTEALGFADVSEGPSNFRAWLTSLVLSLSDEAIDTMTSGDTILAKGS